MRQDEELRVRFERAALSVHVDVEPRLGHLHRYARRRATRQRAMALVVGGSVALVGLVAVWRMVPSGVEGADGGVETPTGTIAYMAVSDGGTSLTTGSLDASSGASVGLPLPSPAVFPVWSPDGSRVAYGVGSLDVSDFRVYVADANGADPRRIADGFMKYSLVWSPDGSQIAFAGKTADSKTPTYGVFVVGVDGSNERLVVPGHWESVSWSPAGDRLLLAGYPASKAGPDGSYADPQQDLYTVGVDGSGLTQVTNDRLYEHWASWSPDGMRIAFAASEGYDDVDYLSDVYVVDADGSNRRQLTTWSGFDSFPVWSPDGRSIAFASDRAATAQEQRANRSDGAFSAISIYIMDADGSNPRTALLASHGEALLPSSWKT
jgi:Tol biopolymer transport system component